MKLVLKKCCAAMALAVMCGNIIYAQEDMLREKPLLNKHRVDVECAFFGAPVAWGLNTISGIYTYNPTRWFGVGAGVGLTYSLMYDGEGSSWIMPNFLVRLKFEVPLRKVSPFLTLDAFGNLDFSTQEVLAPSGSAFLGVAIALRNTDRVTVGIGGSLLTFNRGCIGAAIAPMLRIGYAF